MIFGSFHQGKELQRIGFKLVLSLEKCQNSHKVVKGLDFTFILFPTPFIFIKEKIYYKRFLSCIVTDKHIRINSISLIYTLAEIYQEILHRLIIHFP